MMRKEIKNSILAGMAVGGVILGSGCVGNTGEQKPTPVTIVSSSAGGSEPPKPGKKELFGFSEPKITVDGVTQDLDFKDWTVMVCESNPQDPSIVILQESSDEAIIKAQQEGAEKGQFLLLDTWSDKGLIVKNMGGSKCLFDDPYFVIGGFSKEGQTLDAPFAGKVLEVFGLKNTSGITVSTYLAFESNGINYRFNFMDESYETLINTGDDISLNQPLVKSRGGKSENTLIQGSVYNKVLHSIAPVKAIQIAK